MPHASLVTLLTDFGHTDAYVGVMKGVILSTSPEVRLVDLTHAVPAQSVVQGAFLLESAWRYFPAGTVHLAVVDPGVGTSRRRLALRANGQTFVGPDNGLLSSALADFIRGWRAVGATYDPHSVALPPEVEAVAIDMGRFGVSPSATFEGRDVFAPTVARLANGAPLSELGDVIQDIEAFPAFRAPADGSDGLDGLILHADTYGNLISDIRGADLPKSVTFEAGHHYFKLARTYGDASGPCAIVGSSGFVEIAMPGGSAAATLGLGPGARLRAVR